MKTTTRNRIIGIVLIVAMSAGMIISGVSVLMAQNKQDEEQAEHGGSSQTSSQQQSASKAARESVTGYFGDLKKGNIAEAYAFVSEQMTDPFGIRDRQKQLNESAAAEPAEIQEILNDYFRYSSSQYVRDYAIEQSVQSGDDAAFLVRVTAADFTKQKQRDEEAYNQQIQDYVAGHLDELNEIASSQSQEAADNYLKAMKMKSYYSDSKADIDALPDQELRFEVITSKQPDGTYQIQSISESAQ